MKHRSPKSFSSFSALNFLATFLVTIGLLTFAPAALASFTLISGSETDLCTAPKYSGQADLIGRFRHNKFLFQNHQTYEFRLSTGQAEQLPLFTKKFAHLNDLLKLNITADQAAKLPTDRVIKIKVSNYQAYCEGLSVADFVSSDETFKNKEGNFVLIQGSPEEGFVDTILYQGEQMLMGMLRATPNEEDPSQIDYTIELTPESQAALPLQNWRKAQPDWNSEVFVENRKENAWLFPHVDQKVSVLIDQYSAIVESLPIIRPVANFIDVDHINTSAFADAIQFLKSHNIVDGYSDETFRPAQTLNRAEFAKIALLSIMGQDDITPTAGCFSDVQDDWFSSYVCALKDGKAIQGYTDGKFHPEKTITVAEALKIMMKIFAIDYETTPVWTDGIMAKAAEKKLLTFPVNSPSDLLTRGQMASIIMQIVTLPS